MTPLEHLAAAIEKGTVGQFRNLDSEFGKGNGIHAKRAYNGSLDAAKWLHDSVLPGWVASIDTDGFGRVYWPGPVITVMETVRLEGHPARAWLLAIVRAIIAQETKE